MMPHAINAVQDTKRSRPRTGMTLSVRSRKWDGRTKTMAVNGNRYAPTVNKEMRWEPE
jgi:hypothetical protein